MGSSNSWCEHPVWKIVKTLLEKKKKKTTGYIVVLKVENSLFFKIDNIVFNIEYSILLLRLMQMSNAVV